jgi:hypothetical protein
VIFSGVFLTILLLMATPVQALITVANTSDSGAGSLRQAIADAASGEEIQFGVTGTITLTGGELTIGKNLTITGPGSGSLSIDGNNASRVFYINSSSVTVNMSGITVTNGNSANWGGGIENEGTLNLTDCLISGCSANGAGNGYGGGLDNYQGTVTVTNCTISGNSSTTDGGGLATYGGSITLSECTVSGNSSDNGAGIANSSNAGGTIDVIRCTVYNNNATAGSNNYGGGIFCNGGTLNLTNSTISGNSAVSGGGGIIDGAAATITITQCTIVDNTSTNGGGGIELGSSHANIKNTILANNTGGGANNFYSGGGALNSQGYNLENNTEAGFTVGGDIQNGTIDLDPIAGNGGPTQTHALQYSSDAVDAIPEGGTGYNGAPATDQRGTARPQSTNVDIGAFELEQAPQLTTQAATGIGPTSATGNGTITSLGSPNPTAHGLVWNTGGTPTLADSSSNEGAASATGAFTSNMTGLSPYTTYYVRAYATNANGTSYGNEVSFATSGILPTVTTQAVSGIGTTSATGSGNITSLGVPNPNAHGLVWNTTGSPTLADSSSSEGPASATGAFTSNMTGLSPNTTYYVRAFATNAQGTAYGGEVNFTTAPQAPTVTTQAVTGIGTTTATGSGTIISLGVPNPTAHGVCWNTGGNPTLADNSSDEGAASATGAFTSNMTGLSSYTTYYVRAYATNTGGTAYGNQVSFTTNAQLPTVTTQAVSGIGTTTATGSGTITSLGAPNPTAHGLVWNTGGSPTLADNSSNEGAASATGTFTSNMTGLSPNTTYYVRAYATNTAGTAYGGEVNFTTSPQAPTVTTQAVSGIGTTTATGSGTITSLGVPDPTAHGVCWNTTGNPTLADSSTNEGAAAAGAFTSNMTGLSAGTTYYVRAYATNTGGTAYGNQVSFTTSAQLPTVTTQAVTDIAATTATGSGTITSLGAPNPTAHGVCWNTTGTPTTAASSTNEGPAAATGAFTSNMTALSPNTTYYVRAYAANAAGTAYGSQVSFTTPRQGVVISGHVTTDSGEPLADVLLTFSNNGGTAVSDHRGHYSRRLRQNWSGTVTPSKEGYRFVPESRSYTDVTTDRRNQDYQALPLTPLTVTITNPAGGDTVYGTVPVEAQVPAAALANSVEFFVDGQPIGSGLPLMNVEPVIEFDFSAALLLFITPDRQLAKLDRLGNVSPVCRTPVNVREILWDTDRDLLVVLDMPRLLNDNNRYRVLRVDARTGLYRGVTEPEPLLSRLKSENSRRRFSVLQAELLPRQIALDQLDVRPDGLLAWGGCDEREDSYKVGRLDLNRPAAVEPLMFRLPYPVHGLRAFPAQWWSGPPFTGETVTYRLDWDTAAYGNGSHELKAAAYDAAGSTAEDRIDVIVANISLSLSALRKTERAWIIARDYSRLDILVANPAGAAGFVIYRKTGSGNYQVIKQFGPAELVDGSYTFNDQFLDKQQSYTYRVEAVDAAGMVMGVSNEVTI